MSGPATEILLHLIRPEFKAWEIKKLDGSTEPFDPLTLLGSFLESEIPLDSAFHLFDATVDQVSRFFSDNLNPERLITHSQIHATVATCIADMKHAQAASWLANYENIYGPDLDELATEDGYILVRHATELQDAVLSILAQMTGTTEKDVENYLSRREFRTITNRLIKLIRYCGFYRVKKSFLEQFCEELANRSVKGIVPTLGFGSDEALARLDDAERWIVMSRESRANPVRAFNLLELALEDIGELGLRRFGLLPLSASKRSFKQFATMLKTVGEIAKSERLVLPDLDTIRTQVTDSLMMVGSTVSEFVAECDLVHDCIVHGRIVEGCAAAERLLNGTRVMLSPNDALTQLKSIRDQPETVRVYLELAAKVISNGGISSHVQDSDELLAIPVDYDFHELVELGRVLRVRCAFETVDGLLPEDWLAATSLDLESSKEIACLVITSKELNPHAVDEIRATVSSYGARCISHLTRHAFEDAIRQPKLLRDVVLQSFRRLVPDVAAKLGRVFQRPGPNLAFSVPHDDQGAFNNAVACIEGRRADDACNSVSKRLDVVLKEHVHLLCAAIRHGLQHEEDFLGTLTNPGAPSMKAHVDWLWDLTRSVERLKETRLALGKFIPDTQLLKEIDLLRDARNVYTHEDREIDVREAKQFLERVARVLTDLRHHASTFERGVVLERTGKAWSVLSPSGIHTISGSRKVKTGSHLEPGCCVHLVDRKRLFPVFHAITYCIRCRELTQLDSAKLEGTQAIAMCSSGGHEMHLERPWQRLVRKAAASLATKPIRAVSGVASFAGGNKEGNAEMNHADLANESDKHEVAAKEGHIFISYNRADGDEVNRLRADMISAGHTVWWDQDILPGQDWKSEIQRAMRGAYAVLVCVSYKFSKRKESGVYPEILDAIEAYRQQSPGSIFLILVKLSACEIPLISIDGTRTLHSLQHVDLFPPANRQNAVDRLIMSLDRAREPKSF